jgi:hypothetical protein
MVQKNCFRRLKLLSGAPAEIDIVATDDASDVFQDESRNF